MEFFSQSVVNAGASTSNAVEQEVQVRSPQLNTEHNNNNESSTLPFIIGVAISSLIFIIVTILMFFVVYANGTNDDAEDNVSKTSQVISSLQYPILLAAACFGIGFIRNALSEQVLFLRDE